MLKIMLQYSSSSEVSEYEIRRLFTDAESGNETV